MHEYMSQYVKHSFDPEVDQQLEISSPSADSPNLALTYLVTHDHRLLLLPHLMPLDLLLLVFHANFFNKPVVAQTQSITV